MVPVLVLLRVSPGECATFDSPSIEASLAPGTAREAGPSRTVSSRAVVIEHAAPCR